MLAAHHADPTRKSREGEPSGEGPGADEGRKSKVVGCIDPNQTSDAQPREGEPKQPTIGSPDGLDGGGILGSEVDAEVALLLAFEANLPAVRLGRSEDEGDCGEGSKQDRHTRPIAANA